MHSLSIRSCGVIVGALLAFGLIHDDLGAETPKVKTQFTVEIEGINAGYFATADGLGAEVEVVAYQDGNDLILRKRPGRAKFGDVTLKKGYIDNVELRKWWETCASSKKRCDRKVVIKLLSTPPGDAKGKLVERCSWDLGLSDVKGITGKDKKTTAVIHGRIDKPSCPAMFRSPDKR